MTKTFPSECDPTHMTTVLLADWHIISPEKKAIRNVKRLTDLLNSITTIAGQPFLDRPWAIRTCFNKWFKNPSGEHRCSAAGQRQLHFISTAEKAWLFKMTCKHLQVWRSHQFINCIFQFINCICVIPEVFGLLVASFIEIVSIFQR